MLNHKGSIVIHTERLVLRPFKEADAEPMFYTWANDPEVAQYMTWNAHKTVEETDAILSEWIECSKKINYYHWMIEFEGQPSGTIGVVNANEPNDNCEIGYCIAKNRWGQGIASEAVASVIRFLFKEIGFHRIEAKHDIENIGSSRVMQKCNMLFEAIEREAIKRKNGLYGNRSVYFILNKD